MRTSSLDELLRRAGLGEIPVIAASALADRSTLVGVLQQLSARAGYLAVCRNGVYRSSLCSLALEAEGLSVLSAGTHTGQSYAFLREQLQGARASPAGGLILPAYTRPLRLLVLCIDPDSRQERDEVAPALDWLGYFKRDLGLALELVVLAGREEDHVYY